MRINTPPTLQSYRNHLRDFVDMMVAKLHDNSHKTTPSREQIPDIIALLREELREFEEQLAENRDDLNTLVELADASNFAFLAFVALRSQGVKDARERFIDEFYDIRPSEGKIYCKKMRAGSQYKVGEEIQGHTNQNGYVFIRGQSRKGGSHANIAAPRSHLIWYAATGKWPTGVIDHINRVRDDDRIDNLRDVSCSENSLNSGKPKKLPSFVSRYAVKGRDHTKNFGKFVYQRRFKGTAYRYGYFDTPEEAEVKGLEMFRAEVGYSPTLDL